VPRFGVSYDQPGAEFTVFTYTGTESGEFDFDGTAVANDGFITEGDNTFEIQYDFSDPSVTLTVVEAVPEPGTWAFLLGGRILLVTYQRFRRPRLTRLGPSSPTTASGLINRNRLPGAALKQDQPGKSGDH